MNTSLNINRKLGKSTYLLIFSISVIHLLNYLNYSTVADVINIPMLRAVLLSTVFAWILFTKFSSVFNYHLKNNFDLYAFSLLALFSSIYSRQADSTLLYSAWLFIAIYLSLELSSRLSTFREIQFVLLVVIYPAVVVSGLSNLVFGPEVISTGRLFGALGTHHVDAALALDAILVFLALRSVQSNSFNLKSLTGALLVITLFYSVYFAIFALTRSVWLGILVGLVSFSVSSKQNMKLGIRMVTVLGVLIMSLAVFSDFELSLPVSVEDRVKLTIERYESGVVDARIVHLERGYELIAKQPLLGYGYYSGLRAHNSYVNILIDTGFLGFSILLVAFIRSVAILRRAGSRCLMFFLIGAGGLMVQAVFESQSTPGQANFVPMLLWFVLTRSQFVSDLARGRSQFSDAGSRADLDST